MRGTRPADTIDPKERKAIDTATATAETYADRTIGPVTILFGKDNGKYPDGNAVIVQGSRETAIIDPCLGVVAREERLPPIDRVFHSHAHEDHLAASYLFADKPWHVHRDDLPGLNSMEGLLNMYGIQGAERERFKGVLTNQFNYMPREDALPFDDGDCFDLGGVELTAVHTPGHTAGHSAFVISWEGSDERFVFIGDVDLSSFGPYYSDACGSLEGFEESIAKLREIDARWWLTFHHKGLLEGREQFLPALDAYQGVINRREQRLLDFLTEPRTLEEMVQHRIVYRPGNTSGWVDHTERRTIEQHLVRLIRNEAVEQMVDERYIISGVG